MTTPVQKFELGTLLTDKITGYTGMAYGVTTWLYGCSRYALQSKNLDKDGKVRKLQWFDEYQLEPVVAEQAGKAERPATATGGPQQDPSRW